MFTCQLADMWCLTTSAAEYADFLHQLLRIVRADGSADGTLCWRPLNEVSCSTAQPFLTPPSSFCIMGCLRSPAACTFTSSTTPPFANNPSQVSRLHLHAEWPTAGERLVGAQAANGRAATSATGESLQNADGRSIGRSNEELGASGDSWEATSKLTSPVERSKRSIGQVMRKAAASIQNIGRRRQKLAARRLTRRTGHTTAHQAAAHARAPSHAATGDADGISGVDGVTAPRTAAAVSVGFHSSAKRFTEAGAHESASSTSHACGQDEHVAARGPLTARAQLGDKSASSRPGVGFGSGSSRFGIEAAAALAAAAQANVRPSPHTTRKQVAFALSRARIEQKGSQTATGGSRSASGEGAGRSAGVAVCTITAPLEAPSLARSPEHDAQSTRFWSGLNLASPRVYHSPESSPVRLPHRLESRESLGLPFQANPSPPPSTPQSSSARSALPHLPSALLKAETAPAVPHPQLLGSFAELPSTAAVTHPYARPSPTHATRRLAATTTPAERGTATSISRPGVCVAPLAASHARTEPLELTARTQLTYCPGPGQGVLLKGTARAEPCRHAAIPDMCMSHPSAGRLEAWSAASSCDSSTMLGGALQSPRRRKVSYRPLLAVAAPREQEADVAIRQQNPGSKGRRRVEFLAAASEPVASSVPLAPLNPPRLPRSPRKPSERGLLPLQPQHTVSAMGHGPRIYTVAPGQPMTARLPSWGDRIFVDYQHQKFSRWNVFA